MPSESLRLRDGTTSPELRATTGEGALRQDGFVAEVPVVNAAAIKANVYRVGTNPNSWQVDVDWTADSIPSNTAPASGFGIKEIRISSSWEGPPEFWNDGLSAVATFTESNVDTSTLIHDNVTSTQALGNWMYYSLFYKYHDLGGTVYVSRVATTSVLIPTYWNLSSSMWNRIPSYYRQLDSYGHLERFIELFGYDSDENRTLVNEAINIKDPLITHYDSLSDLASLVGVPFTSNELRPTQMRELIYDTDKYFDSKGRVDTLIDVLSVLTDSEVSSREYKPTGAAASAYNRCHLVVSASQVNLIPDPRFKAVSGTNWNYLVDQTSATVTVTEAGDGITLSTDGTGAGTVYLFPTTPIQIKRQVPYYSSISASMVNATAKQYLHRELPTNALALPDESPHFSTDDPTFASNYKDLATDTLDGARITSGAMSQISGYDIGTGYAETDAVFYNVGTLHASLFRARLYADAPVSLEGFTLKLTQVAGFASSASRFDRFDLALNDGTTDIIAENNYTINASDQIEDEDVATVITKLTVLSGGVNYTLLLDEVVTLGGFAADKALTGAVTNFAFRDTGVEQLFPTMAITLAANSSVVLDKWIVQPFSDGRYFDGSSSDGFAYIDGLSQLVSDQDWVGTADASVSLYTPIKNRNRAAVRKALTHNLPVTMSIEIATPHSDLDHGHFVTFDAIPGDEQDYDPHSWLADVYSPGDIRTNSD